MSSHLEFLARTNRTNQAAGPQPLTAAGPQPLAPTIPPSVRTPQPPPVTDLGPSALSDSNQWIRIAWALELGKPGKEVASVGIFPSTDDTQEPGSFVISMATALKTLYRCRAVIVDLDVEGSELALAVGAPSGPGVGCALELEPNLRRDCIHSTRIEDVDLIPCGVSLPEYRPNELERRLRWMDGALAEVYPLIVYRFPRAKRRQALRNCYRVPRISFLTVTPGVSRKSDIRSEAEFLKKAGANLAGVVLTEDSRCHRAQQPVERPAHFQGY